MSGPVRFVLVVAGGILLSLSGMWLGLWWVTFAAAVAVGLALPRTWLALVAGAVSGAVAWSEPLVAAQAQYGIAPTATALAAIMGVKGAALVPIALTVLTGVLLGLSGAWLGAAVRALVVGRPRSGPAEKLGDQRLEVKDSVLTKS
jgi:hypothetical protein